MSEWEHQHHCPHTDEDNEAHKNNFDVLILQNDVLAVSE
jgi:hypothetical protein